MADFFFSRRRSAPFRLSDARRAALSSLGDHEALANAEADPDNPPVDPEQLKPAARRPGGPLKRRKV